MSILLVNHYDSINLIQGRSTLIWWDMNSFDTNRLIHGMVINLLLISLQPRPSYNLDRRGRLVQLSVVWA